MLFYSVGVQSLLESIERFAFRSSVLDGFETEGERIGKDIATVLSIERATGHCLILNIYIYFISV